MPGNPDFKDLLSTFNDADVRYLIVGAYALIHYSEPRFTKDLDLWVEPSPENGRRVYEALGRFGAPLEDVSPESFADPDLVFQIGIEPNRIDVLMGVTGLVFTQSFHSSLSASYEGIPVRVLALEDIIRNKQLMDRPQDRVDLEVLEKLRQDM